MKLTIACCLLVLVVGSQAEEWQNYDAGFKPAGDYSAAYPTDEYPAPYQPYRPPKHYQFRPENPVLYREIPVPQNIPVYAASVVLPFPPYKH